MPESATLEVLVAGRRDEAEDIISLELVALNGAPLPPFEAGAHIDVFLRENLVRQYSICSDPRVLSTYVLGVLREKQSRGGSNAIHDDLIVGKRIRIGYPRNKFRLSEDATHSIFAAGGIGITPIVAMAWRLFELDASFEIHYCTRSLGRTAFGSALRRTAYADRLHLHLDDGPEMQRFIPDRHLADPQTGKHLYVCGPLGFMNYIFDAASRHGWAERNIHREYFSTEVDLAGTRFSVRAARSGITVEIPSDKTIAEVLMENGVNVPLSCESGVCGTCLTTVLQGVPDHRDMFQTLDEKASNKQMTLCCSRAKSSLLVLDL